MTTERIIPKCVGCGKRPNQLPEYLDMAQESEMTPEQFVMSEEGTYNRKNGHFYCTECYCKAGMPIGVAP